MKISRLHRLFHPKAGKWFDVAIDPGFFNEASFLDGIDRLAPDAALQMFLPSES